MTPDRVEHYLRWVNREIDNLQVVDTQGGLPTLAIEDRLALRPEWDDVVDRYLAVVAAHDAGQLPRDLQQQLAELSARLAEQAPVLDRLRLRQPDPEILARLRLAAAS